MTKEERENVVFFDTTCRDGKQSPGNNHGPADTVRLAHQLTKLGVNVMEAGFAASSEMDFTSVRRVAEETEGIVPCSLARALPGDIRAAAKALENARVSPRIHTFIATSDCHLDYKLRLTRSEALEKAVNAVELALQYVDDVEFSAEDATRSDRVFLSEIVKAAVEAGAKTINLPDTVGYCMPEMIGSMVTYILQSVPEIHERGVVLSVHCHNDLGCATANALAGVLAGARQVECTINGIGERAGNTHYAEVFASLQMNQDHFGVSHDLAMSEIGPTARLLTAVVDREVPGNLPIVGRNVFAHGSGIHQDGVAKHTQTYEILKPESVGWTAEGFPLSSQSGRAGLSQRLNMLGYLLPEDDLESVYEDFLQIADSKKLVTNNDLYFLMQQRVSESKSSKYTVRFRRLKYKHEPNEPAHVDMTVTYNGQECLCAGKSDDGPVDAAYKALSDVLERLPVPLGEIVLAEYNLGKGKGGTNARAHAYITLVSDEKVGFAFVKEHDIVKASVRAMVMAINHLLHAPVLKPSVDL